LGRIVLAVLAVLVLCGPPAESAAAGAAVQSATVAPVDPACHEVVTMVHAKRWAWVRKMHRVHGRRVPVRRHGKIVYVRARVSYLKRAVQQTCAASVAGPLSPELPVSALAPSTSSASPPPVQPPSDPPPPSDPAPPLNAKRPVISGTPTVGQTLAVSNGSWSENPISYSYRWQRCNELGEECVPIVGATKATHVLLSADQGATIRAQVSASNDAGASAPATSTQTAVIAPEPSVPTNTALPIISGAPTVGETLSVSNGSWTENPTSYSYQWQRCNTLGEQCAAIAGATKATYVLASADQGATIRAQLSASNATGPSVPASSTPTAVVQPALPVNTAPPAISGPPTVGETLRVSNGSWTENPTSYSYQWQRCNTLGEECVAIAGETKRTHPLVIADEGSTIRAEVTATNAAGSSAPATSTHTAVIAPEPSAPPTNTAPPVISGTPMVGETLTSSEGSWSENPSGYSYQWQRCNTAGEACEAIAGATEPSIVLAGAQKAFTLRAQVTGTNAAGSSPPATSTQTAVVQPAPPANSSPPVISGNAMVGQTLSASTGSWSENPTGYSYQWQRCSAEGEECETITGATNSGYLLAGADAGATIRAQVSASNASGSSAPATSSQTAVIAPGTSAPTNIARPVISGTPTVGKTLTVSTGKWSESPTSYSYRWQRCNTLGEECAAIAGATKRAYPLASPDAGSTLRAEVTASNAAGPSAPATTTQTAIIAPEPTVPTNTVLPVISGRPTVGRTLTVSTGSWSGSPTSYSYQWQRCNTLGEECAAITGATTRTYPLVSADEGSTIRAEVTASNAAGPSEPALSAASATVTGSEGVQHLEYVFEDGLISVYDIDNAFKLVKTISLPQTNEGVRGATVAPSTHMLFISYGGDGTGFNGSVLAYDLVAERVVWTVHLNTGIDSGQVSPDGTLLYMPTGENTASGIWNVLSTADGSLLKTIAGGAGAHNTVVSSDGRYVYLGGRSYNYLDIYDTATEQVRKIGPLASGVRPFTVNGSNTLAFTTATGHDGFQVSSVVSGKVLFTVSFGLVPPEFPYTAPSHGASLSPDEKELYVTDSVNKVVRIEDVSGVAEGIAPSEVAAIPVAGLTGTETPCAYDCGRDGWVQGSIDGRYVFVGDSGDVIETATRTVVATLPTLLNTRKSLEVEWASGVPVATSGRTGVGQVG
jgi:hypothetical protein